VIERRTFLGTLIGSLLAAPLAPEGQQAGKVPRIGWVGNMAPPPPPVSQLDGFRQGLRELGYVEGQNLVIEYRWAAGKLDRLPDLVADLVRLKVDVLLVAGQQGLDAAKRAGSGTPAVLVACDPLEALVGSLARPGGPATGLTCISPPQTWPRRGWRCSRSWCLVYPVSTLSTTRPIRTS
jgi:putative ABC transport system substrate-binding protein